jgi:hypothetical protein
MYYLLLQKKKKKKKKKKKRLPKRLQVSILKRQKN